MNVYVTELEKWVESGLSTFEIRRLVAEIYFSSSQLHHNWGDTNIAEFDKKLDTLRKRRYAQDQKNGTPSKADLQKSVSYLGTNHILRNHF